MDKWLWHDGWDGRWMDGWAGGQTDRQTAGSRQEVTTWLGKAVLEVMDGTQRGLRGPGRWGRKEEAWRDGQTD